MKTAPEPDGKPGGPPSAGILQDSTGRKQAEEEAQFQRQLLQTVLDHMPAAVGLIRGSDLRIQLVNPVYQALAPGKAMVGKTLDELWAETGEDFTALCRAVLETGEPHHREDAPYTIRRTPDGPLEQAYFSGSLHRVRLPGEDGFGILSTAWETTERKKTEQALRESEERLRAITETSMTPVGVGSLDGTVIYVNRAYEELFGFGPGELMGRRAEDLYWDQNDRKTWVEDIRQGRPVRGIEMRMRRKDGTLFWAILSIAPISYGGKNALMGTVVDITGHKKAEEALRASEANLRGILDATRESIWVFDTDGVALLANAVAVARIGKPAREIVGKRMEQIIPPELARSRMERLAEVVRTGRPVEFEDERAGMQFRHSFYPVRDPGGAVTAVVSFSRDITERKKAEETMRHLASFPQLSQSIIMELDLEGRLAYANPFSTHLAKDLRLEGPGDLLPKEMAGVFRELQDHPGSTANREVAFVDRTFQLGIFRPRGIERYRVYGIDITERKRAEYSLAETRDYLEKLVNHANAPIIVWSPDSRITRFNGAFEMMSGFKAGEVLGKNLELLFPQDSKEASLREIQRTLAGGQWETIEIPILRKDGSTRIVLWNSANIYDKDGRTVISTIAQGQDITERKRGELALQKARERNAQQEKLAAIGRLAGGVAHELRNPLAAMKNAAYYLGMVADRSDPSVVETLSVLNREIARSNDIISSLLGLARPAQPSRTEIDVSAVLETTIGTLRLPPGVTLETRLDEALPPVAADPGQLSIVFGNILRNACDAMPGGGRLAVTSMAEGGRVVVAITDSGTGMPPEVLSRLFEPLFSTKQGGTGLGLSVAKMLVEGSGGTIEAQSEPEKGSTFTVRLPARWRAEG